MSAPVLATSAAQPQGQPRPDLQQLILRARLLRQNPHEQKFPNELEQLMRYISNVGQMQVRAHPAPLNLAQQQQQSQFLQHPNGTPPSLINGTVATSFSSGLAPSQDVPPPSQTPVFFTGDQINALRAQIRAYKLISRGMPVPESLHQSIRVPNDAITHIEKLVQGPDVSTRIVDAVVKVSKGEMTPRKHPAEETIKSEVQTNFSPEDFPKGPLVEVDINSGIYPYNAYRHPFSHLKRNADTNASLFATRLQRLIVPTIMPAGLDAHQIMNERDRFIEARIRQRICELESLSSTIGDGSFDNAFIADEISKEEKDLPNVTALKPQNGSISHIGALIHPSPNAHGKLRAVIELKSLRLLEKQRSLRANVAERLYHGSMLPLNRLDFRRFRKPTLRDARTTESLERKQRMDRERRAKHKHVEQLSVICQHGRDVLAANRSAQERLQRLGRAVLNFHAQTEKEEQKRIERISKERLKALKADDEEAYMKLIDTAKDTRITHLLRQTDSYLDSLAQAVVAQQNEAGPVLDLNFEQEEGPATEATFGAQITPDDAADDNSKIDYYAVAHRISEKISRQPVVLVGGTLKEYQLKGLQWMISLYNNRLNGILADEMGLGKTIQTISLITFLIESKRQRGPYLVIVPLSTMTNWSGEFAKWAPSVKTISYKGGPGVRRPMQAELRMGNFQVLLTTYEYIIKDRPLLSKIKWLHMIIDEGHRMKNTQSKLVQTLTTYYHSRYRLILTGTPLQNNLPELWALLNFVLPKIFNSVKSFDEWFNTPFANSGTGDKIELNEEEALLIIRRLHKVLRPFLLRRLKKDVENELPDKVEKVIKVRMSALQSQLYKQMKKYKMIADGKERKGKLSGVVKGLSNELMQLRKICQHPFLFESVEDKISPGSFVNDTLIRTSGKMELLSRILPKFFATNHRVLIFFQMTKVMDIMEDFLKMMNSRYLRLDGGTKTEERASFVQMFNAKDSEYMLFILSTRAGGLGLNLQSADTVILFDSDWNPHADLQAQDRAHRIGQTRSVLILRFITEKSVEEAMYQRARFKLDIDGKVIQAGRFDNKSTNEEQEEMLRSILEADQEEENEEAGDMNDEELNEHISRSAEETIIFRDIDLKRERDHLDEWRRKGNRGKPPLALMQLDELPDCYKSEEPFELKENDDVPEGRGQRRRNAVSYNDGLSDDAWAMALEDGQDVQELSERTRRSRTNRLVKEVELSNHGTPVSDSDARGRKGKKGKAKANDHDSNAGSKRKRSMKSMSVTPSDNGDEDEEPDMKRRKMKGSQSDVQTSERERMKKAFAECHRVLSECKDQQGRLRCELFLELPDRRRYPDYYTLITRPIAMSQLRKKANAGMYKTVLAFREDWQLMFNNARTYNQEGSDVYVDAEEMEKAFNAIFERVMAGSRLPGAPTMPAGTMPYDEALTPMEEDERLPVTRGRSGVRKQVISDEEYLTQSEDE